MYYPSRQDQGHVTGKLSFCQGHVAGKLTYYQDRVPPPRQDQGNIAGKFDIVMLQVNCHTVKVMLQVTDIISRKGLVSTDSLHVIHFAHKGSAFAGGVGDCLCVYMCNYLLLNCITLVYQMHNRRYMHLFSLNR